MIRSLTLLCLLVANQVLAAEEPARTAPPEAADMRVIFNGKDRSGWDGDPRLWSVKGGVLRGETTTENPAKGNTFIIWEDGRTKDFELRLSFRCSASNNSGIQYRSKHITEGKIGNPWIVRGYQHELRNEITLPNVAGFIYDEGGKRGRICLVGEQVIWETTGKKLVAADLIDQAAYEKLFRLDDWNDVVIVARGNHVQHYLNNKLILDFTDNHPELALGEGILALQLHAGMPMWVEFKNIRIKVFEQTAKRIHHVWHVDLTAVPTQLGFWTSWFPFSLPQSWPCYFWNAVVVDHFSRRAMGGATFDKQPTTDDVCKFLDRTIRKTGAKPGTS